MLTMALVSMNLFSATNEGSSSKSRTRYTLIDVEQAIADYENGEKNAVSKSLYNTLKTELKSKVGELEEFTLKGNIMKKIFIIKGVNM